MHPDHLKFNLESARGQQIRNARAREVSARNQVNKLEADLEVARTTLGHMTAHRRRIELWDRADQLRKELARVENEAGNIRVES